MLQALIIAAERQFPLTNGQCGLRCFIIRYKSDCITKCLNHVKHRFLNMRELLSIIRTLLVTVSPMTFNLGPEDSKAYLTT